MTSKHHRPTLLILLTLQFIGSLSMSMVYSLAPTITTNLNLKLSDAPLLNIGFLGAGLLAPFFGYSADKRGAKTVLILGSAIFTAGHFLAAFSTSIPVYVLARTMVGLGYTAIVGLIVSYLAHLTSHEEMGPISAFLKLAFALGVFAAPLVAVELVTRFDFKTLYLAITAIGALLTIAMFFITDVRSEHSETMNLKEVNVLLKNKKLWLFMGVSLATSLPGILFFNFLSVYLSDVGFSQSAVATVYSLAGIGTIASAFVIYFLNKRFSLLTIFRQGLVVSLVALVPILTMVPSIVVGVTVLFALGYDTIVGLINPVLALEYPRHSGTVIMLISLLGAVYGILINLIGPMMYPSVGFFGMIAVAVLGMILGMVSLHMALKKV